MLEAFTVPVIPNCDPLNVKLLLSCNSPPVPASTTRPDVKSSTEDNILAELAVIHHEELQRSLY